MKSFIKHGTDAIDATVSTTKERVTSSLVFETPWSTGLRVVAFVIPSSLYTFDELVYMLKDTGPLRPLVERLTQERVHSYSNIITP